MRVLQINAVYGFGSTGVIVKDIAQKIKDEGGMAFVAFTESNIFNENCYKIGNKLDWKLHALFSRIFGKQAYFSKGATKRLLCFIKKIKPDIVHLHNLHSNYINLNLLLSFLAKENIATVVTLHDCWFFTGKCMHFIESKCDKWQKACGNCPRNKLDVKSFFFDKTNKVLIDKKKHFDKIKNLTVVGCSDWMSNLAKSSAVFGGHSVITIRNGVDTDIFKPTENLFRKTKNIKNKFVVLGMANKWLDKTNENAFNYLRENLPSDSVIVLVGCNELQKQSLSKYDNIISVGYIKSKEGLADIYSSADVFVNLTHADTLPTVNMESICSGTPVITFDVCGSPELIIDGKTGYIVKEDDYRVVLDKILEVKNGKSMLEDCVSVGKAEFNKDKKYLEYIDLYKSIVGEKDDQC